MNVTREKVLFTAGLALTVYEALARQAERPYLLALYAGMMGLPIFTARRDPPPPPRHLEPPSPKEITAGGGS